MGVTISRRGPKLVFASVLAGGALVASAVGAFAWTPPTVTQKCFKAATSTIEVDVNGGVDQQDKPIATTQVLYGKSGQVLTTDRFVDTSNGVEAFTYTVLPQEDCKPAQTTTASAPRTNPPSTPAPSGAGAGTPGLPNTGFDPNA
jgi:hypothetical protein